MSPEKFVAGTIIAKLPPSWNDIATSLKNKRHEFSVLDLISTLDFEEKARAKDTRARVAEGASSAHTVHEKNFQTTSPKTTRTNLRGKASLMQRTSRHILPTSRRILITGRDTNLNFGSTAQNLYGCIYLLSANLMVLQVFLHS